MFILRQITKAGHCSNTILGNRYSVIHKEYRPEEFQEILKETVSHPDKSTIFAVLWHLRSDNSEERYPLYKGHHYYIMTSSGETFEKIK